MSWLFEDELDMWKLAFYCGRVGDEGRRTVSALGIAVVEKRFTV